MVVTAGAAGAAFQPGPPERVAAVSSSVSAIERQSFEVFPDGQRLVVFESGTGASVDHLTLETNIAGRARKAPRAWWALRLFHIDVKILATIFTCG